MKATIWHHPRCSKSRQALGLLQAAGTDVTVIEYLKQPPTAAELARLYDRAGLHPRDGLRRAEPGAAAILDLDAEAILDAMSLDPILIERPLVETAQGVVLARPPEKVRDIL